MKQKRSILRAKEGRHKMRLSDEMIAMYQKTAKALKGTERRQFMAGVVKSLGWGGQSYAAVVFQWGRNTIRKGIEELESGIAIEDQFAKRGRPKAEEQFPQLLDDIGAIVDGQSQTDPTFQSNRLYTRLSAAEVRRQLIQQKGYSEEDIPSQETIRVKLNELGYRLRSVQKSRPQKDS
jgi:Rhodopirellula transposase DDE domain